MNKYLFACRSLNKPHTSSGMSSRIQLYNIITLARVIRVRMWGWEVGRRLTLMNTLKWHSFAPVLAFLSNTKMYLLMFYGFGVPGAGLCVLRIFHILNLVGQNWPTNAAKPIFLRNCQSGRTCRGYFIRTLQFNND